MVTQTILLVITGWHIFFALIALLLVFGIIYQFTVKNKFASLDVQLNALVVSRTAKLSSIVTIIKQSVEVTEAGKDYAVQITEAITKARIAGPGELFRVLTEATIPINPDLYTKLLPTVQGLWSEMQEFEISIQSKLATRNTMLVVVPEKWFLTGETRQIPPIVTSEASAMATSGVLTVPKLFNEK